MPEYCPRILRDDVRQHWPEHVPTASHDRDLVAVTLAYLECAEWLDLDDPQSFDDGEETPEWSGDWSPSAIAEAATDCAAFVAATRATDSSDWSDSSFGHDYWLTRNHHGAGFWDRSYKSGKALTAAAHSTGGAMAYVGDDGLAYLCAS